MEEFRDDSVEGIAKKLRDFPTVFGDAVLMLIAGTKSGGWILSKPLEGKRIVSAGDKSFELGESALKTFAKLGLATCGGENQHGDEKYSPTPKSRAVVDALVKP